MCTELRINGVTADTIGGIKKLSPTIYRMALEYVNDPWADGDCLCTVDFDSLVADEPQLNIQKNRGECGWVYGLEFTEPVI